MSGSPCQQPGQVGVARVVGVDTETQDALLLQKAEQSALLSVSLATAKASYAARIAAVDVRKGLIQEARLATAASRERFRYFVNETDAKRERFIAKAATDVAAAAVIAADISDAEGNAAALECSISSTAATIELLQRYSTFLDGVVATAAEGSSSVQDGLRSARDVVARHASLAATQADLHAASCGGRAAVDALRDECAVAERAAADAAALAAGSAHAAARRLAIVTAAAADATAVARAADERQMTAAALAQRAVASLRNLLARVVATAAPNSLPPVTADPETALEEYIRSAVAICGDRLEDLTDIAGIVVVPGAVNVTRSGGNQPPNRAQKIRTRTANAVNDTARQHGSGAALLRGAALPGAGLASGTPASVTAQGTAVQPPLGGSRIAPGSTCTSSRPMLAPGHPTGQQLRRGGVGQGSGFTGVAASRLGVGPGGASALPPHTYYTAIVVPVLGPGMSRAA